MIVVGESGVGKTSLAAALAKRPGATQQQEQQEDAVVAAMMQEAAKEVGETRASTIGVDCQPVWIPIVSGRRNAGDEDEEEEDVPFGETRVQIWDTAGQERFRSIVRGYFRNADIALLVCSADSGPSVDAIASHWLKDVQDHCPTLVTCGILCNKTDAPTTATTATNSGTLRSSLHRLSDEEEGDVEWVLSARDAAEELARVKALPFASCSMVNDPLPALHLVQGLAAEALRRRRREAPTPTAQQPRSVAEEEGQPWMRQPISAPSAQSDVFDPRFPPVFGNSAFDPVHGVPSAPPHFFDVPTSLTWDDDAQDRIIRISQPPSSAFDSSGFRRPLHERKRRSSRKGCCSV